MKMTSPPSNFIGGGFNDSSNSLSSAAEDAETTPALFSYSPPKGGGASATRSRLGKEEYKMDFETLEQMAEFLAKNRFVRLVDCCFCDALGSWHHCTFSSDMCTANRMKEGLAFDGSSINMLADISQSDLVMIPDPQTCWIDPFCAHATLHATCSIFHPDGRSHEKCPRETLRRCRDFLRETDIADEVLFGPEAEFFIFNSVHYDVQPHHVEFHIDGEEAYWNSRVPHGHAGSSHATPVVSTLLNCSPSTPEFGRLGLGQGGNLGHRVQLKKSYMTSRPTDSLTDIRSSMLLMLADLGMTVEKHHHEAATCQVELDFKFDDVVKSADNFMTMKYSVKNVARANGKTATFMPKPISCDNGSGMHCNQSLWKANKNLFFDPDSEYCRLSSMALHYIAGILHHAPAVVAFTCPTVNSYRRLAPGFEAPVKLTYSKGNRTAAIRIPNLDIDDPKTKRIEFRTPDASSCPYLAFAAQVMAGIDGVLNKMTPPPPADSILNKEVAKFADVPGSLEEALDALEKDHDFLTRGGVFSKQLIKEFINFKRDEVRSFKVIAHPREFALYFGC